MITSKNARSRLLIVLLFIIVVFAFPGCNLNNTQVYKQVGKTEIDAYAATKVEINYSAYNWEVLCNVVDWGKSSIDEATTKPHIDTIIQNTKNSIDAVLEKRQMQDFKLLIATNKTSFYKDEDIMIDISLENQSGDDVQIAYYFLITPHIPSATDYPATTEIPPEPYTMVFKDGEVIHRTNELGGYFATGQHEIKYKATFFVNYGKVYESMLEIWSNTIKIKIVEN